MLHLYEETTESIERRNPTVGAAQLLADSQPRSSGRPTKSNGDKLFAF